MDLGHPGVSVLTAVVAVRPGPGNAGMGIVEDLI